MRKRIAMSVVGMLLGLAAMAVADIPFFWLDKPTGRSNPNDPSSPLFVPTSSVPIAPAGSPTITPTRTPTRTATPSFTPDLVNSPTSSFTVSPTPSFTPTPTRTPVACHAAPDIVMHNFNGVQYGTTPGDDYDWAGVTYGPSGELTLGSPLTTAGECGSESFVLNVTTNISAATGADIGIIGTQDIGTATAFTMSILAPQGFTGAVAFTAGAWPNTTFRIVATFSVTASAGWQLVNIPVGNFTMSTPTSGTWTPMAGDVPTNFGIEAAPGTTGPQQVLIDNIGFFTGAVPTATPSVTRTPTPNYSPTATPTAMPGFTGLWYDGDTAGAMAADVTFASETSTAAVSESPTGGYSGAHFSASFSVPAAGYYSSADIARPATDVSAFNQLEFRMRVPSSGGGCLNGGVQLVTSGTAPNDRSRPVTITAYVDGGIPVGSWVHVRIPLTAFNGPNHETPSYSFSAADLASVTAVRFRPYYNDFNADGSFDGAVHIDNLAFSVGAPAPAQRLFGPLLANFETNTASSWGGFWSSYNDQDAPDWTCDDPLQASTRLFPATSADAPIVSDGTGGSDSPCSYGRIAGFKGGPGNSTGCGAGPPEKWSYAGMGINLDPAGGTASVDVPAALGFTPSALRFKIKAGPTHPGGQNYLVTFTLNAPHNTCGGCEWQLRVTPTASWQTITAPFPANGTVGTSSTISATNWGQPSWAGTALTWDSTSLQAARQIAIAPENGNSNYDILWDDIEFVP
jgi:hypothetical protein